MGCSCCLPLKVSDGGRVIGPTLRALIARLLHRIWCAVIRSAVHLNTAERQTGLEAFPARPKLVLVVGYERCFFVCEVSEAVEPVLLNLLAGWCPLYSVAPSRSLCSGGVLAWSGTKSFFFAMCFCSSAKSSTSGLVAPEVEVFIQQCAWVSPYFSMNQLSCKNNAFQPLYTGCSTIKLQLIQMKLDNRAHIKLVS